jgi:transcriptional regulator with XRE-family HTH domain
MVTQFGKLLRIIRVNSGDSAKDMAKKLNMSPSYLSTIENGKRNIPVDMDRLLIESYNLTEQDKTELRKAMLESSEKVKIDLTDLAEKRRRMIFELTDVDLDDSIIDEIHHIIDAKKREDKNNV